MPSFPFGEEVTLPFQQPRNERERERDHRAHTFHDRMSVQQRRTLRRRREGMINWTPMRMRDLREEREGERRGREGGRGASYGGEA